MDLLHLNAIAAVQRGLAFCICTGGSHHRPARSHIQTKCPNPLCPIQKLPSLGPCLLLSLISCLSPLVPFIQTCQVWKISRCPPPNHLLQAPSSPAESHLPFKIDPGMASSSPLCSLRLGLFSSCGGPGNAHASPILAILFCNPLPICVLPVRAHGDQEPSFPLYHHHLTQSLA